MEEVTISLGSPFGKSVCDLIMKSGDKPEANLLIVSMHMSSQTYDQPREPTFTFLASCFATSSSSVKNRSRFAGTVPFDVFQFFLCRYFTVRQDNTSKTKKEKKKAIKKDFWDDYILSTLVAIRSFLSQHTLNRLQ